MPAEILVDDPDIKVMGITHYCGGCNPDSVVCVINEYKRLLTLPGRVGLADKAASVGLKPIHSGPIFDSPKRKGDKINIAVGSLATVYQCPKGEGTITVYLD